MKIITITFLFACLVAPIYADTHTIFAHGIADTPVQIKRFNTAIATDKNHTHIASFSDTEKETGYGINRLISEITTSLKKPINRSKINLGQTQDIAALAKTIQNIPPTDSIILFGCSRGAATCVNTISIHNPCNIAALVLDACPTSMPETLDPKLCNLGIHPSYNNQIFTRLFPAYITDDITPLKAICAIKNKQLPILIVHAKNDTVVPYAHAMQLYITFKAHGFEHVYLASILEGKHAFLLQDPQAKTAYLQAIHTFYKIHHLPFDATYAQDAMTAYQPELSVMHDAIELYYAQLQENYEQSTYRNKLMVYATILLAAGTLALYYHHKNSNS